MSTQPLRMRARRPRRRRPDRRRRAGRPVRRAARSRSSSRRAAASRWRLPSSRRRARPARTCCRAPCSIRRALAELIPDFKERGAPLEADGPRGRRLLPRRTAARSRCRSPAAARNHGNYIISLNRFAKWLADARRSEGHRLLHRLRRRRGVIRRRRAWSASARATAASASTASTKATFEAGVDIRAKVTIFCRRRSRQPDEAAAARGCRWRTDASPQQYAIGIKELWEVPADRVAAGHGDAHAGLSARIGRVRRRLHLRDAGRPHLVWVWSSASTIAIRCSIHTRRSSASSSIRSSRSCCAAARWCATAPRRCLRAAGTRFRSAAWTAALIAGDAGGVPELVPVEGHSSGDDDRDARGGDGVRGGPQPATRRRTALPRVPAIESIAAGCATELYPGAQRAPGLRPRAARRVGVRRR